MSGVTWQVDHLVRVVDGDSIRVVRSRVALLGDDPFRVTDPDPAAGALIRLLWVNTPEAGQPGYREARDDLLAWVTELADRPLLLVTYGRERRGGRVLGDLQDTSGASASQWLMTEGNSGAGWPPYRGEP